MKKETASGFSGHRGQVDHVDLGFEWAARNRRWHAYGGFDNVRHFRDRFARLKPILLASSSADRVRMGGFVPLPLHLNHDKLSESALAILGLSAFGDHQVVRAWKGLDWDLLDALYQKGWIADPKGKAKSIVFTDEGARLAQEFLTRYFGQ